MNLIDRFRHTSICFRLAALMILNGGLALFLVGAFLLGYEKLESRRAAVREVLTQAGIVAENSVAALSFADDRAAVELLKALRRDPKLVHAAVYDQHNQLFASYSRDTVASTVPLNSVRGEPYFEDGSVWVSQPVVLGAERLGTIYLQADLAEVEPRLRRYTGMRSSLLDRKISGVPEPPIFPIVAASIPANGRMAEDVRYRPISHRHWKIIPGYSMLRIKTETDTSSHDSTLAREAANSPHHQPQLRSMLTLRPNLDLDTSIKFVSQLAQSVPGYVRVDARVGWRPTESTEISLVGEDLATGRHIEFLDDSGYFPSARIARSVFCKVSWRF